MITLIIVDVQNDFISGSFRINNASNILTPIKQFISRNCEKISKIILTADWHPYNHCSFKRNGGEFPTHCVQFTPGACIEPKLLKFIQSKNIDYEVITKGSIEEVEECGAFSDIQYKADYFGERYYLDIAEIEADSELVICGVGDCVRFTISNLINSGLTPKLLKEGIAPIDINSFNDFVKENNLEKYE